MFITGAPDYLLKKSNYIMTKSGDLIEFTHTAKRIFNLNIQAQAEEGLRVEGLCLRLDCEELNDY